MPSSLGLPLRNIYITNDQGYDPLVVNTSRSFPRSCLIIVFVNRVTRRVSHMKQELPTLPEHMSAPRICIGVRVAQSLVFCKMFCRSLFVLFLLTILFSVCPFTVFDCPFSIFKMFSHDPIPDYRCTSHRNPTNS